MQAFTFPKNILIRFLSLSKKMASRSVKIKSEYINLAKKIVKQKFGTQQACADSLGIARSTINFFLNGKQVDITKFHEICLELELKPEEIGDWEESHDQSSSDELNIVSNNDIIGTDFSKYIERPDVLSPLDCI